MLKFSAAIASSVTFLPDAGVRGTVVIGVTAGFIEYPIASPRTFVSFATNIDVVVPDGGGVDIQLFHNGNPVADFITGYNPGETGVKTVIAPAPEFFDVADTFYVRVFTFNFAPNFYLATATIGLA